MQSRRRQGKAEKREALLARWRVKYERPAAEVRAAFPPRPPSPPRAVPFASKEERQAERALEKKLGRNVWNGEFHQGEAEKRADAPNWREFRAFADRVHATRKIRDAEQAEKFRRETPDRPNTPTKAQVAVNVVGKVCAALRLDAQGGRKSSAPGARPITSQAANTAPGLGTRRAPANSRASSSMHMPVRGRSGGGPAARSAARRDARRPRSPPSGRGGASPPREVRPRTSGG